MIDVKVVQCGECENWDDEWTKNGIGYCSITDTFWFPFEFCSRGELDVEGHRDDTMP